MLEVKSDEFGFRPLFYWSDSTGVIVSESVNAIVDKLDSLSLDIEALSVFLRFGCFLGEDTAFRGIRQLSPNSTLTWSLGEGVRNRMGSRPSGQLLSRINRNDAVRAYGQLFQKTVNQAATVAPMGRLVVPLSGGRDSRHIAFALHAAGIKPMAYASARHLPWKADEDVRIAKAVCDALDARHVVLSQPRFPLANSLSAIREMGYLSQEHGWLVPIRNWTGENADTIFDGIGGDIMSAALFQTRQLHDEFRRGNLGAVTDKVFAHSSLQGWEGLLSPDLLGALSLSVARRRLTRELELHANHHNPVRSFYFWNRTRRQIALSPFCLFRHVRVVTPYLAPELWSYLDGLPFEIVADHAFHDEAISRAYPSLAHVPYEDKMARRPFRRGEAFGVGLEFVRLLLSFGVVEGINFSRLLRRSIGSLRDHRVWWSQTGALYLLALLDVSKLELSTGRRS